MPLPKRRHSTTRRDKRRANWKLTAPTLASCPSCAKPHLPHTVCTYCGFYNGEIVWRLQQKAPKT